LGGGGKGEPGHEARLEEHLHQLQQASRTIMKLTMNSVSSKVTRKERGKSPKIWPCLRRPLQTIKGNLARKGGGGHPGTLVFRELTVALWWLYSCLSLCEGTG